MSARASRRQVLAAIALADVPMPSRISFIDDRGVVGVSLDRIAHLHPWAELTGVTAEQLGDALAGIDTYPNGSSGELMSQTALYPKWMGWRFSVIAAEVATSPVELLDDATREQLRAVAGETPADSRPRGAADRPAAAGNGDADPAPTTPGAGSADLDAQPDGDQ